MPNRTRDDVSFIFFLLRGLIAVTFILFNFPSRQEESTSGRLNISDRLNFLLQHWSIDQTASAVAANAAEPPPSRRCHCDRRCIPLTVLLTWESTPYLCCRQTYKSLGVNPERNLNPQVQGSEDAVTLTHGHHLHGPPLPVDDHDDGSPDSRT